MDTTLERIQAKIADLEAKISDLRIVERELQALDRPAAATTRKTRATRKTKAAPAPKQKRQPKAGAAAEPRQTIGGAVSEVLIKHGPLQVAEIADQIQATGKDINRRAISFTLQALKKRGLVKSADGKWSAVKGRG